MVDFRALPPVILLTVSAARGAEVRILLRFDNEGANGCGEDELARYPWRRCETKSWSASTKTPTCDNRSDVVTSIPIEWQWGSWVIPRVMR